MKISTVILLPRLELYSLHLLSGDVQDSGHSALRETKHRVEGWLKIIELKKNI